MAMLSVCEQLVVLVHGCGGIDTPEGLARLRLMVARLGECLALWVSGSDPTDTSVDGSMHTAQVSELR